MGHKHRHHSKKCEKQCDKTRVIESSPYTITHSGNYCLTTNLPVNSFAIQILASNVVLDLSNHTITLNTDTANGIIIDNARRITIKNGTITSPTRSVDPTNMGISINNSSNIELSNILIEETGYGVYINASSGITMTDLNLYNMGVGEIHTVNSKDIKILESSFENIVNDLVVAGIRFDTTDNIVLKDLQLKNTDIFARTGNGILVDSVNSINDDNTYFYGLFQYGTNMDAGTDPNLRGFNGGIVQNSVFANVNSLDAGPSAVFAISGDTWLFNNCTFECNRSDWSSTETAVFFVGGNVVFPNMSGTDPNQIAYVTNLRVANCNLNGVATWGFLAASTPIDSINLNVVVENCNISQCIYGVGLYEEISDVIQNCKINYCEYGVHITGNSAYCAILSNTISYDGVGIIIDAGTNFNLIKENNVFFNGTITDNGTDTQLINNTVFA